MESDSSHTIAIGLTKDIELQSQLKWAVQLALSMKSDLLLYYRIETSTQRVIESDIANPKQGEAKIVFGALDQVVRQYPELESDLPGVISWKGSAKKSRIRLKLIYFKEFSSLRDLLLRELEVEGISIFTAMPQKFESQSDIDLLKERRLFLRYIPCKVLIRLGPIVPIKMKKILLLVSNSPSGREAYKTARKLAKASNASVTLLHVNPNVGQYSDVIGQRRLEHFRDIVDPNRKFNDKTQVVIHNLLYKGVRKELGRQDYDVFIIGIDASGVMTNQIYKQLRGVPAIVVCAASPFANRFRKFVEEGIQYFVPQIGREDRIDLVDRVQSSSEWNFDFLALMVLATTIAAIGLMQNSAAVVIGAMLVAPLMTPLLGLGVAFVQGNSLLAKVSFRSIAYGLLISLLFGFIVGVSNLNFHEPTREMLSRGGPGLLDLFVAAASGLAAAYATSRPTLIAAIPGVAISAALVPPIATAGLALSIGAWYLAIGALILFAVNMVMIVVASMTSLWAVGLRALKKPTRWTVVARNLMLFSVVVFSLFLGFYQHEVEIPEDIPDTLLIAVQKTLGDQHEFESLSVAYDELGVQLNLRIIGKEVATEELATKVRKVARNYFYQPVRVRLVTTVKADEE